MIRFLLAVLLITSTPLALAQGQEPIEIGVSFTIAPYVLQDEDRGIEIDLLREIFHQTRYQAIIRYLPLARSFSMFENRALDGALNVTLDTFQRPYFLTDPIITFQNCAIQLLEADRSLNSVDDLSTGHVLAFQRSLQLLGEDFARAVAQNPDFEEVADQRQQVFRLLKQRNADVVVMEERIYEYYRLHAEDAGFIEASKPVKKECFFTPSHYRLAFHDKAVRDTFNRRLSEIKRSGEYYNIIKRYQ